MSPGTSSIAVSVNTQAATVKSSCPNRSRRCRNLQPRCSAVEAGGGWDVFRWAGDSKVDGMCSCVKAIAGDVAAVAHERPVGDEALLRKRCCGLCCHSKADNQKLHAVRHKVFHYECLI